VIVVEHTPVPAEQSTYPPIELVIVLVHVPLDRQLTVGSNVFVIPTAGILVN
jgi:hypothetical protein